MCVSDPGETTGVLDRGDMGFQKVKFFGAGYAVETPIRVVSNATWRQPIHTHAGIRPKCVEGEHARTHTRWPFVAVFIQGLINLSIYIIRFWFTVLACTHTHTYTHTG